MKIAVLSDVHGNLPALETVTDHVERWSPDLVILNGDIVNRGPLSVACLQFVQEKQSSMGWHVMQGNHEEFVIQRKRPFSGDALFAEIVKSSQWTYDKLNGDVAYMEALPVQLRMNFGNAKLLATHASLRGNRDGLYFKYSEDELRARVPEENPNIFLTSHTHVPFVQQLDETLVVNTGSVGAPFDHDQRLGYAQVVLENNGRFSANIIRLPYDRTRAKRDWHTSGYLAESGSLTTLLYAEWLVTHPLLFNWNKQYSNALKAGEITVTKSVIEYLSKLGIDIT